MNITGAQFLSLVCIFVSMIGVFILPYWWIGRKPESFDGSRYQIALSLANCLSGGVFMATFFVGLMPEVRSMFHDVFDAAKITTEFPITEFVIFVGFLLALGIEQIVLGYRERHANEYTSVPLGNTEDNKSDSSPVSYDMRDVCDTNSVENDSDNLHKASAVAVTCVPPSVSATESPEKFHNHGHSHDISTMLRGERGIRIGMLMVSLGVHSLFEGLALGLQTSMPTLVNLVIGVAVHELLVAFAMGVNVSRMRLTSDAVWKIAVVFAGSIPIGQIAGLLIGANQSAAATAVSAVLQGLAAGTFIHVTFLEVIPAEFHQSGQRLLKVLFLGIGFILLLFCTFLVQSLNIHHVH